MQNTVADTVVEDAPYNENHDFGYADMRSENTWGKKLVGANLSKVRNLLPGDLGATNLRYAKLPEKFEFEGLRQAADITGLARTVFYSLLGTCVFCWLVIWTTKDVQLVTDSEPIEIPFVKFSISIWKVYFVAPIILLVQYWYLHSLLTNLWKELAQLPAVFPDGRKIDQRVSPWLVSSMATLHIPNIRNPDLNFINRMRIKSAAFGMLFPVWLLAPITIASLWLAYLRSHETIGIWVLTLLVVAIVAVGTCYYGKAVFQLRHRKSESSWERIWFDARGIFAFASSLAFVTSLHIQDHHFFHRGSEKFQAIGVKHGAQLFGSSLPSFNTSLFTKIHDRLTFIDDRRFLNLAGVDIVEKPMGWGVSLDKLRRDVAKYVEELEAATRQLKKITLDNRHWRFANVKKAFLVSADLNHSDLGEADMTETDLRSANLTDIQAQSVNLTKAKLDSADMARACMSEKTRLVESSMIDVKLVGANLDSASLVKADLRSSDLSNARLRGATLNEVKLDGSKLFNTDFSGASLQGVNFNGAIFNETNLRGADLTNAKNFTLKQLMSAYIDAKTKLPPDLIGKSGKAFEAKNRVVDSTTQIDPCGNDLKLVVGAAK